jgi:hypothetical protein
VLRCCCACSCKICVANFFTRLLFITIATTVQTASLLTAANPIRIKRMRRLRMLLGISLLLLLCWQQFQLHSTMPQRCHSALHGRQPHKRLRQ